MRKLALILAFVGTGLLSTAVTAEMYRWEKNGKTYYSDQPPPDRQVEKISPQVPGAVKPAPQAGNEQQAQVSKIRGQECDKARARLMEYQNSPVLKQRNLKGEERELTASERIDVIVRAQTDVNELCGEDEETGQGFSPDPENFGNDSTEVDANEGESAAN